MRYFRWIDDIVSVTLVGGLVVLPFFSVSHRMGVFGRQEIIFKVLIVCSVFLVAKSLIWIIAGTGRNENARSSVGAKITILDLFVAAYLLAGLLNIIFIKHFEVDRVLFWRWGAVATVYILVRTIAQKAVILNALVVAGVAQAAVAMGQRAGYIASNHPLFDVTGSFGNPGQLGGFLAVTMVIALGLLIGRLKDDNPRIKAIAVLYILAVVITGTGLILADSRAAIVGVVLGLVVLFGGGLLAWLKGKTKRFLKVAIPAAAVLLIGVAILIFSYRSASADARLLVWRVTAGLAMQKPIAGHGVGSFNEQYMTAQAHYFETHPGSPLADVAANAAYPYNEFLHLLVEQGIVGLAILVALLWVIFVYKPRNNIQRLVLAGLAAWLTFSLFSYPSYVFALLIPMMVLIGLAQSRELYILYIPKWYFGIAVIAFIILGVKAYEQIDYYRRTAKTMRILFSKKNEQAISYIKDNYDKLKHDPAFCGIYAAWLGEKIQNGEDSDADLARMITMPPLCENWCDIGYGYARRGDYAKSDYYYTTAANMIPTRLRPNYLLWKMYMAEGDTLAAHRMAQKLLEMPLKVENDFTIGAKAEVRKYLVTVAH